MNNYVEMSHAIPLHKRLSALLLKKSKFLAKAIFKAALNSLTIYLKYLEIMLTSSFLSDLRFQKQLERNK